MAAHIASVHAGDWVSSADRSLSSASSHAARGAGLTTRPISAMGHRNAPNPANRPQVRRSVRNTGAARAAATTTWVIRYARPTPFSPIVPINAQDRRHEQREQHPLHQRDPPHPALDAREAEEDRRHRLREHAEGEQAQEVRALLGVRRPVHRQHQAGHEQQDQHGGHDERADAAEHRARHLGSRDRSSAPSTVSDTPRFTATSSTE